MKYVKFIFIKEHPAQTQLTYKLYKYEFLYLTKIENLISSDSSVTKPSLRFDLPSPEMEENF